MERTPEPDRRKTTTMSLQIVDAIADLNGARLTAISDYMDIHESTIYTHLKTLEENGYIDRSNNKYYIGVKLLNLGRQARQKEEYLLAKQKVLDLGAEHQSCFSVEENKRIIVLFDEIDDPLADDFQIGKHYHMHNSSAGKAILAEYSDSRVEEIIDEWGLPKIQDNTITSREALFDELKRTQERGYAINDQESLEGLHSVAVAVEHPRGEVFGALDIFGPAYLLPDDQELAEALKSAVNDLESEFKQ